MAAAIRPTTVRRFTIDLHDWNEGWGGSCVSLGEQARIEERWFGKWPLNLGDQRRLLDCPISQGKTVLDVMIALLSGKLRKLLIPRIGITVDHPQWTLR